MTYFKNVMAKLKKVDLSQDELIAIISLLELNEDNDDFQSDERKEFSKIRDKLVKLCDLYGICKVGQLTYL